MKKGYRFGAGSAQAAGMTRVAKCPELSPPVFTPHRGLKEARSSCTSTVEGKKKADYVRCPDTALSDGSTVPTSLATPLPLLDLGAMATEKVRGLRKERRRCSDGRRWRNLRKEGREDGGSELRKGTRKGVKVSGAPAVTPFLWG